MKKHFCHCSFITLEGADSGQASDVSNREVEASKRTVDCIAACRIEDIFADSKFLRAESLHELVKAIMWAAGPIKRAIMLPEESDTAQVRRFLCMRSQWALLRQDAWKASWLTAIACSLKACMSW